MSATDALMVRAPRDSGLASFLRLFNRDPSAIKLVTLEHLIIKYISFFRLRDPTNPSMIWGNVNLTNSLSGNRVFHASQLRGILCGIVDPVDGLTVQQVKGTSTIFGDWIQAGDSFFISESFRALLGIYDNFHATGNQRYQHIKKKKNHTKS